MAITQLEAASGSYNAGVALAADESEGAPRHGVALSDALIERDFGCSASEFLAQMTHADEGIHKQAKRKARALQKRFKGLSGVFVLGAGEPWKALAGPGDVLYRVAGYDFSNFVSFLTLG